MPLLESKLLSLLLNPICIYIYIYICTQTCTHIVKLLYELRSRVVCYPKIKLNPRAPGLCFILCCA